MNAYKIFIEVLIEKFVGQISFEKMSERKKEEKLAAIGSEMMLLYIKLNEVIVVGQEINDILKRIVVEPKEKRWHISSPVTLKFLLRKQADQILEVIASFIRLRPEIGVVDKNSGIVMRRLLFYKAGLLLKVIGEHASNKDTYYEHFNSDKGLNKFLRIFDKEALNHYLISENDVYNNLSEAFNSGLIIDLDKPLDRQLAQRILDLGGEENLQAIKGETQSLRDQIEKYFTLKDVLLKVNDKRAICLDRTIILSKLT